MGLDNVGTEIYAIQGYFQGLMVGQRTPGLGRHKYFCFLCGLRHHNK